MTKQTEFDRKPTSNGKITIPSQSLEKLGIKDDPTQEILHVTLERDGE